MKVLTPETRVGLLTIVAAVALLYISLKTVGMSLFGGGDYMKFYVNFPTVSGVEESSKVRLSGVEIGQIELIELKDDHAMVTIRLTRKANIRKDSIATIRTAGLLGEQFISIEQGSPGVPILQDGDTLKRVKEPADLGDIATSVQSLIEENKNALRDAIANLSTITSEFARTAPNLAENLDKTMQGLRDIIENNQDNLTASISNAKELTELLKAIIKENRGNLKTTMSNLATASEKIDTMLTSLTNMSDSFGAVADRISEGEGTIGKLVREDDVYDNLNTALVGANTFLNKAEGIGLYLGIRAEQQIHQNESKAFVSLKVQTREDRYYLVEATQDLRNKKRGRQIAIRSILYTALVAKRFSDLTISGGLIESSAGMGIDYYMFDDAVQLRAELFNLSGYDELAPDPQLKIMARWNFLKYLYMYIGGDELFNQEYRTLLLGAGIMFDDEELKIALGAL
ncbi:hypothetical protein MNBD_NITROSPINAE02-2190 [hydrothermal vent metagenome]|uniref:Mce/MlaD domain-containing protein n=1 Tax=hydrothermal vent metagenome TaxID=652676 RepID=A0A3B1CUB7_9ZZZZ